MSEDGRTPVPSGGRGTPEESGGPGSGGAKAPPFQNRGEKSRLVHLTTHTKLRVQNDRFCVLARGKGGSWHYHTLRRAVPAPGHPPMVARSAGGSPYLTEQF